jgi:hypothetical protein
MVKPGGELRFAAVGESNLRSVDWRIWTSPSFDDVYLAARQAAGVIKGSLHQTGSWQHGFVSEEKARQHLPDDAMRHFAIWQRPPEVAPGWTLAARSSSLRRSCNPEWLLDLQRSL